MAQPVKLPKPKPQAQSTFEWWNPVSWWNSWFDTVRNWIGGLAGDIASGIEGGTVAVLKDIWEVILPFIEILAGAWIAMQVIIIYLASTNAGQSAIQSILTVRK